jgi:hypothetical protein
MNRFKFFLMAFLAVTLFATTSCDEDMPEPDPVEIPEPPVMSTDTEDFMALVAGKTGVITEFYCDDVNGVTVMSGDCTGNLTISFGEFNNFNRASVTIKECGGETFDAIIDIQTATELEIVVEDDTTSSAGYEFLRSFKDYMRIELWPSTIDDITIVRMRKIDEDGDLTEITKSLAASFEND